MPHHGVFYSKEDRNRLNNEKVKGTKPLGCWLSRAIRVCRDHQRDSRKKLGLVGFPWLHGSPIITLTRDRPRLFVSTDAEIEESQLLLSPRTAEELRDAPSLWTDIQWKRMIKLATTKSNPRQLQKKAALFYTGHYKSNSPCKSYVFSLDVAHPSVNHAISAEAQPHPAPAEERTGAPQASSDSAKERNQSQSYARIAAKATSLVSDSIPTRTITPQEEPHDRSQSCPHHLFSAGPWTQKDVACLEASCQFYHICKTWWQYEKDGKGSMCEHGGEGIIHEDTDLRQAVVHFRTNRSV